MPDLSTRAVQPGRDRLGAVQTPLYQNAAYAYPGPVELEQLKDQVKLVYAEILVPRLQRQSETGLEAVEDFDQALEEV